MDVNIQHRDLWKEVLSAIEPTITRSNFITWFADTSVKDFEDGKLTVCVPTTFAQNWIISKYMNTILEAGKKVNSEIKEINCIVDGSLKNKDNVNKVNIVKIVRDTDKKLRKLPNKPEVRVTRNLDSRMLNPKYRLDNYIVGQENKLVHAACVTTASRPGSFYNPLFIYGGVGLGKTHLLQAIGNEILMNDPNKVVVYLTSERFMNEMIEAIRHKKMKQFKSKYRHVDCLLVDDIQFLMKKEATQTEFFHTFNDLYDLNKQIVISSDRPPAELNAFADRLKSRFEMGMVLDIICPTSETRLKILKNKCNEQGVLIENNVLSYIADNVNNNVRELEGVFKQLIAYSTIQGCLPTIKLVEQILMKLSKSNKPRLQRTIIRSTSDILGVVSKYYNIPATDIISNKRSKEVALARHVSIYLIRTLFNYSFERIGMDCGGRNHTTMLYAYKIISKKMGLDPTLSNDISNIQNNLNLTLK